MSAARKWARWLAAAGLLAAAVALVYWRLLFTNLVLATGDAFTYFLPYRDYANAALRAGRLPLWNPYLFMGVPFLANPQAAVLYPLHWPLVGLDAARSLMASAVLHLWLAALGAAVYARRRAGLGWPASLAVGLVFGLSGYLAARVGQINQLAAIAWLPWALAVAQPTPLGLAGLALVVALQLLAGHTQAAFISATGVLLVSAWPLAAALWAWAARREPLNRAALWDGLRGLAAATAAVGLGALLAGVQILPSLELAEQSVRSGGLPYREAVSFSLRPRGLLLTLLPAFGENLADRFASPAYAEFVAYVGVAALALAGLGLAYGRRLGYGGAVSVGALLVVVGVALGLGGYNPLTYLLYKAVPGFDLFRAPARWMALYTFGVGLLAGVGLQAAASTGLALPKPGDALARALGRVRQRPLPALLAAAALLLALAWQRWPGPLTLVAWGAVAAVVLLILRLGRPPWRAPMLLALITAELAAAGLALDHARPTAREAATSLRTAPAHLLAAAARAEAEGRLPGRFLSLSGITYDPGDLADIQRMFADQLPPQAIYDFVVASKLQEIVAPNLSLLWRLPAVDGYDGGVLPLRRYVALQSLFLPAERLSPDGRLREQLEEVPPPRLLRLLGVEHVITDKVFDVWLDDVYYDLQLSRRLAAADEAVSIAADGRLEATAIGLFTHLEGAADLPDGTPVAEVTVEDPAGRRRAFTLRAGQDTAEGAWSSAAQHGQPALRHPWPRDGGGWDYLARLELGEPTTVQRVAVRRLAGSAAVVVRGVSLIDSRTAAHAALTVPPAGSSVVQRVHSGDVKVYRLADTLPRAYLVFRGQTAQDDEGALAALADPAFDPAQGVVLLGPELAEAGLAEEPSAGTGGGRVEVISSAAERLALRVEADAPGFLVRTESWYPGWQATVDGRPAPLLRANLLFQAVPVPAGSHEVVFEFRPGSLARGAVVSAAAALAVLALAAWGAARARPNRQA
ncbi:MAG: YfhO family protein [Anaerolineae bacterium]|nr:YfhO family protein [Anaerolineae bacterium]